MNGGRVLGRLLAVVIALRTAWRSRRGHVRAGADAGAPVDGSDGRLADDPSRREVPASPRAEVRVSLLLFAAAGCALAFIAFYVVQKRNTQLLGLSMGFALLLLASAAIIAGKEVVPQETSVEPREPLARASETAEVAEIVHEGGEGISRRGLITCAGCVAGGAVAVAAVTPLASLGTPPRALHNIPWRRGVRLVDLEGRRLAADDIQIGTFYSALPENLNPELFGAGLLVVRLPESMIHLPAGRAGWTPRGIMGFSKICTHAGCAISLYRYPTYASTSTDLPAFTCPCHYSTFAPGDGGKVIFGPAGRPLPQLPLMIDAAGDLTAAGQFDEDIGPAWWGVRRT